MSALAPLPGGYRVGVDIGGTFTDIVLERDDGQMHTTKVLTTPCAPEVGALEGIDVVLRAAGIAPADPRPIGKSKN